VKLRFDAEPFQLKVVSPAHGWSYPGCQSFTDSVCMFTIGDQHFLEQCEVDCLALSEPISINSHRAPSLIGKGSEDFFAACVG
jgi:hypothetical protein